METPRQWIALAFAVMVCGYAAYAGRRPERWTAAIMLAAWIATPFVANKQDWLSPQYGIAAVDVALLAYLIWLALKSDRYWPMAAAATHGVGVVTHLAFLLDDQVLPRAYLTGNYIWGYLTIVVLAVGAHYEGRHRPHFVR